MSTDRPSVVGLVDIRLIGAPEPAEQAAARLGELFALDRHYGPYPSRKDPGRVRHYLAGRLRPAPDAEPAFPASDARGLLVAVHEALAIPFPATVGDTGRYRELLEQRAMHASLALRRVLKDLEEPRLPPDLAFEVGYLRDRLAQHPPAGYKTGPWPGVPVDGEQQPAASPEGGAGS